MLVDVVRLRAEGVKRGRDEVLADQPARGVLLLNRPPCSTNYRHRLYAGLMGPDGRWLLPVLEPATVHRISPRGMLIRGTERIQLERSKEVLFAQAWWCRPVAEPRHDAASTCFGISGPSGRSATGCRHGRPRGPGAAISDVSTDAAPPLQSPDGS